MWLISTSDQILKMVQHSEDKQFGIEFMRNEKNRLHLGEKILSEITSSYQKLKVKMEEIQHKQVQLDGTILKLGNYNISIVSAKKTNETTQQSMLVDDQSLLRDQSFAMDVFIHDDAFSLGCSQSITPMPSSSSHSTVPSLRQSKDNFFSSKKVDNTPGKLEAAFDGKPDKVNLASSDIFDDDALKLCNMLGKNVKELVLSKNKISDIGAIRLIETMVRSNIKELNLQSNLVTEKTLN